MMEHTQQIEEVLTYWFGQGTEDRSKLWFGQDDAVDAAIREQLGELHARAGAGFLDDWASSPRGRLALIILLDQLSRNIHRSSAEAFAHDARALALAIEGMKLGHDRALSLLERWFFYMPLEHAEDLALQEQSVRAFEELAAEAPPEQKAMFESALDYARRHRDVIARFGRFPHRNEVLGRPSTDAEREHLARGVWF